MDRNEYEGRLRALDQRLESSIEVLRAAHRVERRALDYLWMSSPGNTDTGAPPSPSLPEPAVAPLTPVALFRAPAPPPQPASPARRPRRWRASDLTDYILDLAEELPGEFSRDDILERLKDNPPERSMLYRVLQQLAWERALVVVERGGGRHPVRYRRAEEDDAPEPAGNGAATD